MYRHIPLVALSLLSSLFLAACGNGTPPPAAARPAIVVQPQPAGEVSQAFPGEIRARHEPELAFRIGGKVIRRLVEVGERVKKDQPLAELDPQDVRLQLEAARAQVSAAEANLQTVRAEYRRYRTLLDRNLVSHSQFENIQNSYRAGEARLKQIRAEFNVADNQAGYAVLRSPQDGVIASRRVEVGQVVAAGQTVFSLDADGERGELLGLLPGRARLQKRLTALALQEVELPEGRLRGHTFHHSTLDCAVEPLARGVCPNGRNTAEAVFRLGRLTASYIHFYLPSNPQAAAALLAPARDAD